MKKNVNHVSTFSNCFLKLQKNTKKSLSLKPMSLCQQYNNDQICLTLIKNVLLPLIHNKCTSWFSIKLSVAAQRYILWIGGSDIFVCWDGSSSIRTTSYELSKSNPFQEPSKPKGHHSSKLLYIFFSRSECQAV
jgi:hypothetical protein